MRAFLAIELSDDLKGEILRVKHLIEKSGFLRAKYVETENLHLTLKFFGDVLEREAVMIADALKGVEFPSFSCRLGGLGFFGDKILWIDLEDQGEIKKLHDVIDEKLGDFFESDLRFHNHVTLARIKHITDKEKLIEIVERISVKPVEFVVKDVKLKKSELRSEGPVYEDIWRLELTGGK